MTANITTQLPLAADAARERGPGPGPERAAGASAGLSSLTSDDLAAVPGEVLRRLREARTVLTVGHYDPDGDALGAAVAIALAVEELGGRATPVCSDPVPAMYRFLRGMERIQPEPDSALAYDLIVIGDCGDLHRVGALLEANADLFARVPIVNIDHHKSNPGFGAADWIDPSSAATCEMVTLLVAALGVPLDAADGAIAASLMAGVVIDTANFQHPNTTPRTLRVAAALRDAGAPLPEIARQLYRSKPNEQLLLFGLVLARLHAELDGRLVWSSLTRDDFARAGALPAHSEGLVDLMSQSDTADLAILFKDHGPETRLSVRTRDGGVDATQLTGRFGGGGHARAAGATVELPLADAQPLVLREARALLATRDAR